MSMNAPRYEVYKKHRSSKRGIGCGFLTDDLGRAKQAADNAAKSWWGQNGVYTWIKVKDHTKNKYVYTALEQKENNV